MILSWESVASSQILQTHPSCSPFQYFVMMYTEGACWSCMSSERYMQLMVWCMCLNETLV